MAEPLSVREIFQFKELSLDATFIKVSVHWNGDPMLLYEEGRPPFPRNPVLNELQDWYRTVPKAHHIVHLAREGMRHLRITNDGSSRITSFVQPLSDGWLLVDGRKGRARILDSEGVLLNTLDLGDAIKDVQTTGDGLIWVSYFDEGVFGGGPGKDGLVCFDSTGRSIFRYGELALSAKLPFIDDCYALNVCEDRVWLCYYSEFPLICLKDFQLEGRTEPPSAMGTFAIRDGVMFYTRPYRVSTIHSFEFTGKREQEFDPVDEGGFFLKDFQGRNYARFASDEESLKRYKPFRVVARDQRLYLYTEQTLYELPR